MINGLWLCLLASNNNVEIIKACGYDESDIRVADILFDRLDRAQMEICKAAGFSLHLAEIK